MPLWVKVGNDFVREISGFRRIGNRINGCAVDIQDGILLGEYATEERAKEVFEEIEQAIRGRAKCRIFFEGRPISEVPIEEIKKIYDVWNDAWKKEKVPAMFYDFGKLMDIKNVYVKKLSGITTEYREIEGKHFIFTMPEK